MNDHQVMVEYSISCTIKCDANCNHIKQRDKIEMFCKSPTRMVLDKQRCYHSNLWILNVFVCVFVFCIFVFLYFVYLCSCICICVSVFVFVFLYLYLCLDILNKGVAGPILSSPWILSGTQHLKLCMATHSYINPSIRLLYTKL